jgi:hypothetical protein
MANKLGVQVIFPPASLFAALLEIGPYLMNVKVFRSLVCSGKFRVITVAKVQEFKYP